MTDLRPILVVPAVPDGNGIVFLRKDQQVNIGEKNVNLIWKILRHCNGYNDEETISRQSGIDNETVREVVDSLMELGVLVDSREQYLHFHSISSYPGGYLRHLSQSEIADYTDRPWKAEKNGEEHNFHTEYSILHTLIEQRSSCRAFSDEKLSLDQIGSICHYAYHIPDHSIPSGGALYPLHLFVLIEKDQVGIDSGYYEYDALNDRLIRFDSDVDVESLKYCFNSEELSFGSAVQIVIAADLSRHAYKYSNRGYRLTLIEAGHVAENICLFCAEKEIGTCELGGILDEELRSELGVQLYPLLGIAIGRPGREKADVNKLAYVEKMTGSDSPVHHARCRVLSHNPGFYGAVTEYINGFGNQQFAGATSPSYVDALFKATIEGYERFLSGKSRCDFKGTAEELTSRGKDYLGMDALAPLTGEQSIDCGVAPYSATLTIPWVQGSRADGQEVYIPADIVFYGQADHENRTYYGHSSGIAAHFNRDKAVELALTELIERDAIMRNWYLMEKPERIKDDILPIHAQKRIEYWKQLGRDVVFLEMKSEFGEVIMTAVFSDSPPCFVCGAAATLKVNDIEKTIIKALQEAEYNLILSLDEEWNIKPEEVKTPTDHGRLYHQREYAETLRWLTNGEEVSHFSLKQNKDYREVLKQVNGIIVNIGEIEELKAVRVLSPELVPINFGYHTAHYTHKSVMGEQERNKTRLPHYFS